MQLADVSVRLRPRHSWEAIDFGHRLMRREAASVYATWFAVSLPLFLACLALGLFTSAGAWGLVLYWWLEPVADGPMLDVLSRRVFGDRRGASVSMRATGRLALRNWIFWLSPWRLHPGRSLAMPITQLEGLSGKRRRKRARIINRRALSYAMGLTLAFHNVALALYLGLFLGAAMILPEVFADGSLWDRLTDTESDSETTLVFEFLGFYLAQSALQPWFVAGGFGLYLDRRTRLEGWDIEIAFRRVAGARPRGSALAAAAAVFLCALTPGIGDAAQKAFSDEDKSDAVPKFHQDIGAYAAFFDIDHLRETRTAARTVYAGPEFNEKQSQGAWRRREPREVRESAEPALQSEYIARILQIALWAGLGVLVLALLVYGVRNLRARPKIAREQPIEALTLAGGEVVTRESVPEDIAAAVLALWQRGESRAALALFYRSTVFRLAERFDISVRAGATEGDCLRLARAAAPAPLYTVFADVVRAWQGIAYARRAPDAARVAVLCDAWRQAYHTEPTT